MILLAFDPAWIRNEFNLPATISDHDIRAAADFVLDRATKELNIITGNYLEWLELCKQYRINVNPMWIPVFSLDSFSGRYFGETVFSIRRRTLWARFGLGEGDARAAPPGGVDAVS